MSIFCLTCDESYDDDDDYDYDVSFTYILIVPFIRLNLSEGVCVCLFVCKYVFDGCGVRVDDGVNWITNELVYCFILKRELSLSLSSSVSICRCV